MTFLIRDRRPNPEIGPEIDRLRDLANDLERICRGEHPGRRKLTEVPVIEKWRMTQRLELCLTGHIHRHPVIGDGKESFTSPLWVFAPDLGYARTLSRLYALGTPDIGLHTSRH